MSFNHGSAVALVFVEDQSIETLTDAQLSIVEGEGRRSDNLEKDRAAAAAAAAAREDGARLFRRPPRPRRGVKDRSSKPPVPGPGYDVQRVEIDGRKFVRRYIRCGKKCSVCSPGGAHYDADRPGHGPYWFQLHGTIVGSGVRAGKPRMEYIGETLIMEPEERKRITALRKAQREAAKAKKQEEKA